MAHASAPTLVLRLQPKIHPNMVRVLEYCADMDARARCCILKPKLGAPDAKSQWQRVAFAKPAPVDKQEELPVLLVPDDIYQKLLKNYQRFQRTMYHGMMYLHGERHSGEFNGHWDAGLYSLLARAEIDPALREKVYTVFCFNTYWHDMSCMEDVGELAAELDGGESKEDKYTQRGDDLCDIVFSAEGMCKMTVHELFSKIRHIEGEVIVIELQVNTVGPWTLYNALQQYMQSLLPAGSDIEGWDFFEETCAGERPEKPGKRQRLTGGSGAAGGCVRP